MSYLFLLLNKSRFVLGNMLKILSTYWFQQTQENLRIHQSLDWRSVQVLDLKRRTAQISDFWNLKTPTNPLPKDHLLRKHELTMSIWNLAEKHECFEATELALKHALDILRFDVHDNLKVKNLIVFLFLNLGKFLFLFLTY